MMVIDLRRPPSLFDAPKLVVGKQPKEDYCITLVWAKALSACRSFSFTSSHPAMHVFQPEEPRLPVPLNLETVQPSLAPARPCNRCCCRGDPGTRQPPLDGGGIKGRSHCHTRYKRQEIKKTRIVRQPLQLESKPHFALGCRPASSNCRVKGTDLSP
jgi:hypothetical protein